jgi:hypothetical protein
MARHETDREDLLAEATALRRRVELRVPGEPGPIVAGERDDGSWSVYFEGDPVYHFDAANRLRRAFVGGALFRTQGTTLARLTRNRTPAATELLRADLTAADLAELLETARNRCETLCCHLASDGVEVLRQVPIGDETLLIELRQRIAEWFASGLALAPAIRGKR